MLAYAGRHVAVTSAASGWVLPRIDPHRSGRSVPDLDTIIATLVYGRLGRFAAGEIAVTDSLPILDRAVFCRTSGYKIQRGQTADQPARSQIYRQQKKACAPVARTKGHYATR